MHRLTRLFPIAAVLCWGSLQASPALAGDLYFSGRMFVSNVTGSSGGFTTFNFTPNGSDSDSSPVWGGALGFELGLDEPLPDDAEWPVPAWKLRVELEGLGGRDYELRTKGGDGFFSESVSWTVMQNLWVDMPMAGAVTSMLGRVPLLEPLSFHLGAGAGLAINELDVTDNVSAGNTTAYGLAWQAGAGFGYALTDLVTFSLGYRYQDLGTVEADLSAQGNPVGRFELDLAAHELTAGLRVRFFAVPIPRFER